MFQFRAYASSKGYPLRDGLPHSDTHGSTLLCSSPWLFAALHVLHRLCMPRHPPCALNHFNYKACTRSSSPLKDQNPAHNPTVIRLIVASEILSDSQLPLAHIPRTLAGARSRRATASRAGSRTSSRSSATSSSPFPSFSISLRARLALASLA